MTTTHRRLAAASALAVAVAGLAVGPFAGPAQAAYKIESKCTGWHYKDSGHIRREHTCAELDGQNSGANVLISAFMWTEAQYQSRPDGAWHRDTSSSVHVDGNTLINGNPGPGANKTEKDGYAAFRTGNATCRPGSTASAIAFGYTYVQLPDVRC